MNDETNTRQQQQTNLTTSTIKLLIAATPIFIIIACAVFYCLAVSFYSGYLSEYGVSISFFNYNLDNLLYCGFYYISINLGNFAAALTFAIFMFVIVIIALICFHFEKNVFKKNRQKLSSNKKTKPEKNSNTSLGTTRIFFIALVMYLGFCFVLSATLIILGGLLLNGPRETGKKSAEYQKIHLKPKDISTIYYTRNNKPDTLKGYIVQSGQQYTAIFLNNKTVLIPTRSITKITSPA